VLHRLEADGLLSSTWATAAGRRRRVYRLTRRGRAALAERRAEWSSFAHAVEAVLA
jgi:DNA-binding PadR family transcriptional regulator